MNHVLNVVKAQSNVLHVLMDMLSKGIIAYKSAMMDSIKIIQVSVKNVELAVKLAPLQIAVHNALIRL